MLIFLFPPDFTTCEMVHDGQSDVRVGSDVKMEVMLRWNCIEAVLNSVVCG